MGDDVDGDTNVASAMEVEVLTYEGPIPCQGRSLSRKKDFHPSTPLPFFIKHINRSTVYLSCSMPHGSVKETMCSFGNLRDPHLVCTFC